MCEEKTQEREFIYCVTREREPCLLVRLVRYRQLLCFLSNIALKSNNYQSAPAAIITHILKSRKLVYFLTMIVSSDSENENESSDSEYDTDKEN